MQIHALSPPRARTLVALVAALPLGGVGHPHSGGPTKPDAADPCTDPPVLEVGETVPAVLKPGGIHCYGIELRTGEYVKLTVERIGRSAGAVLWLPGITRETVERRLGYSRGEVRGGSQVVTAVAATDGVHPVSVGPLRDGGPALPYRIELTELLSPERYGERLERARSDPRVTWLRENAVRLRSIAPDDEDFSDLAPLEEILEGVDVVMLGEAAHLDGPTYHAKTRLVKFLHEELGFDVLVFENDFYATWKLRQAIEEGESPRDLVGRRWLLGIYDAREFLPLLEYVAERAPTERPLELAGAAAFVGRYSDTLLPDLERYLEEIGLEVDDEPVYERVHAGLTEAREARRALRRGDAPADQPFGEPELPEFRASVGAPQEAIRSRRPDDRTAAFWIQVLDNAPGWLEGQLADFRNMAKYPEEGRSGLLSFGVDSVSDDDFCGSGDVAWAENLVWLAEEYFPGRKMIVWAHTAHLYRYPYTITPHGISFRQHRCAHQHTRLEDNTVMGHDVHAAFGDRVYTLGVISYEGEELVDGPINRDPVEELDLNELFYLAGHEHALLDLRSPGEDGAWLHDRLYARTWFPHSRVHRARWPAVLDGFLFIREEKPAEYLGR